MTSERRAELRQMAQTGMKVAYSSPSRDAAVAGLAADLGTAMIQNLAHGLDESLDDNQFLEDLYDLQDKRMRRATKMWQNAHRKHDVFPDLGRLLDWLMERKTQ